MICSKNILIITFTLFFFAAKAQVWEGNLYLPTQYSIDSFIAQQELVNALPLKKINGYLFLGAAQANTESDVIDISYLSELDTISTHFFVNNTRLQNLSPLSSLKSIMGVNISISNNDSLTSLLGLDSLVLNNGLTKLSITNNKALQSIGSLTGCIKLNTINMAQNTALLNLEGFENLTNVGPFTLFKNGLTTIDNIELDSCWTLDIQEPNLESIVLMHIKEQGPYVGLIDCTNLSNTDGFVIDSLWYNYFNFDLRNNPTITHLDGFKMTHIESTNINIENNNQLDSLVFLSELMSSSHINIFDNYSFKQLDLRNLSGSDYLTNEYDLAVKNNQSLKTILLDNVQGFGYFQITNNANLEKIESEQSAFPDTIEYLDILNNPRLKDIGPVQNIRTSHYINIFGCDSLGEVNFHRFSSFIPGNGNNNGDISISHAKRIWGFDSLKVARQMNLKSNLIDGFDSLNEAGQVRLTCDSLFGFLSIDSSSAMVFDSCNYIDHQFGQYLRKNMEFVFRGVSTDVPLFPTLDTVTSLQTIGFSLNNPKSLHRLQQFNLRLISFENYYTDDSIPSTWHIGTLNGVPCEDFVFAITKSKRIKSLNYDLPALDIFRFAILQNDSLNTLDNLRFLKTKKGRLENNPLLTDCSALCQIFSNRTNSYINANYEISNNPSPCNLPEFLSIDCDSLISKVDLIPAATGFSLLLYPNPAQGQAVFVAASENKLLEKGIVQVFDLQAKACVAPAVFYADGHFSIDISRLDSGLYFVKWTSNSGLELFARLAVEK